MQQKSQNRKANRKTRVSETAVTEGRAAGTLLPWVSDAAEALGAGAQTDPGGLSGASRPTSVRCDLWHGLRAPALPGCGLGGPGLPVPAGSVTCSEKAKQPSFPVKFLKITARLLKQMRHHRNT